MKTPPMLYHVPEKCCDVILEASGSGNIITIYVLYIIGILKMPWKLCVQRAMAFCAI